MKVSNCQCCPFVSEDNNEGFTWCNISEEVEAAQYHQLPSDKVHELCPLKNGSVTVELQPSLHPV
jgi:hypothetical protein